MITERFSLFSVIFVYLLKFALSASYPSLGYGYSGTPSVYPVVQYQNVIHPPSPNNGYGTQQVLVPGYKEYTGNVNEHVQPKENGCCGNAPAGHPADNGGSHGNVGYRSGPDLSDPCFSKYPNCIIANAQPFERRSYVTIDECKSICLSQSKSVKGGLTNPCDVPTCEVPITSAEGYQCRSIVYDVHKRMCDLYAHFGNAPPAKLVQRYGRDYYESTGASEAICNTGGSTSTTVAVPTEVSCPSGQDARFIKSSGMKLSGSTGSGITLESLTESACLDACSKNQAADGRQAICKSINYSSSSKQCVIFSDSTSKGGPTLSIDTNLDYYEKICFDSNLVQNCPRILESFPNKALIGFAEVVTSASSMAECLQKCLNSQKLFQFACASGMFYADEKSSEANCILNFETRRTRPELFTEETKDSVTYYEPNCIGSSSNGAPPPPPRAVNIRRSQSSMGKFSADDGKLAALELLQTVNSKEAIFNEWTQWTPCDRRVEGRRVRYRRCSKPSFKDCPFESERCSRDRSARLTVKTDDVREISSQRGQNQAICGLDICCPMFGGCRIGLTRSSADGKLTWCSDPCKNETSTKE